MKMTKTTKISRLIATVTLLATCFSVFVTSVAAENIGVVSADESVFVDSLVIDENTDLAALGLEGAVVFGSSDEVYFENEAVEGTAPATPKIAATNAISDGAETKAISPTVPEIETKVVTHEFANGVLDGGTVTLGNGSTYEMHEYLCTDTDNEFDITSNTTWIINGTVKFLSKIVVRNNSTLTIKYGTPTNPTTGYGTDKVCRIASGLDDDDRTTGRHAPNNSKALFNVLAGSGLKIYGKGGTDTTYDYKVRSAYNPDRLVITGLNEPDTPIIYYPNGDAASTLEFIGVDIRNALNTDTTYITARQGGAISLNNSMATFNLVSCYFHNCNAGDGGAVAFRIFKQTTPTVIDRCVFKDCSATNTSYDGDVLNVGQGGAIYFMGTGDASIAPILDSLSIIGCRFEDCRAIEGGAIHIRNKTEDGSTNGPQFTNGITISDTTFEACTTTAVSGYSNGPGGAMYFYPYVCPTITITGCTVNNCISAQNGAFYLAQAANGATAAVISNTSFTNNDSDRGGALYILRDIDVNITDCTMTNNVATYGGGAICYGGSYKGITNVVGGTFTSNKSTYQSDNYVGGGFMYIQTGATGQVNIDSGVYTNNTSLTYGGFLCAPTHTDAEEASGYKYTKTAISIQNSTITGSTAVFDGGAIYAIGENDNFTVNNCTFKNCTATRNGGGIFISYVTKSDDTGITQQGLYGAKFKTVTITNSTFDNCDAVSGEGGGGIYFSPLVCDNLNASGCSFEGCDAMGENGCGGGVFLAPNGFYDYTNLDFTNCSFKNCTAKKDGGGLGAVEQDDAYAADGDNNNQTITVKGEVTLSGCKFDTCSISGAPFTNTTGQTTDRSGAAMYFAGVYSNIIYEGGYVIDCTAHQGVGIMIDGIDRSTAIGNFYIKDVVFQDNETKDGRYGGVIKPAGSIAVIMTLENCVFHGNENNNVGGHGSGINAGAIYWNAGNVTVEGGALSELTLAEVALCGFEIPLSTLTVRGCTFSENKATRGSGGAIFNEATLIVEETVFCNNTAGNHGGAIYSHNYNNANGLMPPQLSLTLGEGTEFFGNAATYGGAMSFVASNSNMDGQIENYLTNYYHGTVSQIPFELILDGAVIYNNTATVCGGGIFFKKETAYDNIASNGTTTYSSFSSVPASEYGYVELKDYFAFNIKLENGMISGNRAGYNLEDDNYSGQEGYGGGIYATATQYPLEVVITGGEIGGEGDGVYTYTKTSLDAADRSVVTEAVSNTFDKSNKVSHGGGGIYVITTSGVQGYNEIHMSNGDIAYNESGNVGGGILANRSTVTFTGGNIYANSAARDGGGLWASQDGAVITITGGIIGSAADTSLGNVAGNNGGGIYIEDQTVLTVNGGCIGYNKATADGGGVYVNNSNANITGGNVVGNRADNRGGGIYAYSTDGASGIEFAFSGGRIGTDSDGNARPNVANYGGGVYVDNAVFEMTKSGDISGAITNNVANVDGGGLYVNSALVTIQGDIVSNIAANDGGGVYLNEAAIDLTGNISSNMAGYTLTVEDNTIAYTAVANSGNGGGIYVASFYVDDADVNEAVINGTISGNTANKNGGGVYATGGTYVTIGGGDVRENTANQNGGGVAAYEGSVVNLAGGKMTENKALSGFGGGVYANNSDVNITGSDVNANSAKNGGGVCVTGGGNLVMTGGLLRYNEAIGRPDAETTAWQRDETLAGVGGGVYLSNGVDANLSTYALTGTDGRFGIYGNLADFAADDVFANGVKTQLTLPRALSMTLEGTEFARATGWFEDYVENDTEYENGLNGNDAIGGKRYKTADRTVIAYVDAADVTASGATGSSYTYINTENTYVCLTLGVAKAGYGEITITKTGVSIDPDQVFVFTVTGTTIADDTQDSKYIEFSVTITGAGSVTISDVPDGTYTITEMTEWSWRYSLTTITVNGAVLNDISSYSGTVSVGATNASPDIVFNNEAVKNSWLDGNSNVAKNIAGTANNTAATTYAFYPVTLDLPKKEELV